MIGANPLQSALGAAVIGANPLQSALQSALGVAMLGDQFAMDPHVVGPAFPASSRRPRPARAGRREDNHSIKDEERYMTQGTVKWFDSVKGYGFISPDDGTKDAFVHISAVERAGLAGLAEGQRVEYELQRGQNGKTAAANLSIVA